MNNKYYEMYQGLFCVLNAVFHLGFAMLCKKKEVADKGSKAPRVTKDAVSASVSDKSTSTDDEDGVTSPKDPKKSDDNKND